jgi:hypothetical protein
MLKKIFFSLLILGQFLHATPSSKFTVTELYIATFDRAPDSKGLNYWLNSGLQLEEIAMSFFEQEETKTKYPIGLSEVDFIEEVYKNLFKRGADSDGFDYWVKELNSHSISRSIFILTIINGALGDDKKILANKTKVGLAFSEDGKDNLEEANSILDNITADLATVNTVLCEYTISGCYTTPKDEVITSTVDDNKTEEKPPVEEEESSNGGGSTPPPSEPTPPPSNTKPVANAGDDKINVARTIPVDINGTGTDSNGDNLTYEWTIKTTSPTGGSIADITNKDTTFTATQAGVYTLSLVVNDGTEDSDEDTMTITVTLPSILKKTGQTISNYSKDDGDYQIGVDHSYTNNGDDTVTDNVTGLMWQDNADVKTVTKKYENSDDSTDTAFTYCKNLTLGNYTDWRLPTIDELVYITDKGRVNPAIDTTKFNNVASNNYWSSTTNAFFSSSAWVVNFNYGNDYNNDKSSSYFVRCVRAG